MSSKCYNNIPSEPFILQSPSYSHDNSVAFDAVTRTERVFTTLIRDQHQGLGFSISGGKGAEPFIEGSDAVFISKVSEDGPAAKDAKLLVGDKIIQVITILSGIDLRGFLCIGLPPLSMFNNNIYRLYCR